MLAGYCFIKDKIYFEEMYFKPKACCVCLFILIQNKMLPDIFLIGLRTN